MVRSAVVVVVLAFVTGCQQVTGPEGPQGPKGDVGPRGEAGATGPQGPQGPQGTEGPAGAVVVVSAADGGLVFVDGGLVVVAGPAGERGPQGQQGPQGAQGSVGAQGPQGVQGLPGTVLVVVSADGGMVEIDGGLAIVSGPSGPRGEQGTQGAQGTQGIPGQSVTGSSIGPGSDCQFGGARFDSNSGASFVCNGPPGQVLWVEVSDGGTASLDGGVLVVSGPTGPQGPIGPTGSPGAVGAQGLMGLGAISVRTADGGIIGFAYPGGRMWLVDAGCFAQIVLTGSTPRLAGYDVGGRLAFASADCSGPLFLNASGGEGNFSAFDCVENDFGGLSVGPLMAADQPVVVALLTLRSTLLIDGGCQTFSGQGLAFQVHEVSAPNLEPFTYGVP